MNFDSEFENNSNGDGPNDIGINDNKTAQSDKKKSSFLRKDSSKYTDKILKRGVIYISRIPPFMKPNRARSLFEQYGEVTRIYLAEEDSGKRKLRKSNGGNGSKHFTEGWVEYADKSTARSVAESLNNKPIGITKGDYYHDDIWNLKYLKGFKWDYLTEKIAYERRVREQKLRVAMTQAKKDNAEFVELLEKSQVEKHVQERKKKRNLTEVTSTVVSECASNVQQSASSSFSQENSTSTSTAVKKQRFFRQNRSFGLLHGEDSSKIDKSVLQSILSKKLQK